MHEQRCQERHHLRGKPFAAFAYLCRLESLFLAFTKMLSALR